MNRWTVDSHTHRTGHQVSLSPYYRTENLATRKLPAGAQEAIICFCLRIPAHYGRVGECTGCCLQMGGRAQASHRLRWEGGGVSTITEITLCLGLYAATAVGGGLVLRSIRVSAQFRFNVDIILLYSNRFLLRCAKDIPDEFLKKQFSIFGEVVHAGLGQGGEGKLVPVVGLRHQPILARRAGASSASLPCVIRGVAIEPDLKSQAKQAIESEVIGKKVKVTLLDTDGEEVGVRLRLKAWGVWRICLAEKLVGLGLGKTLPAHSLPPLFMSALEKQERRAKRKRLGLWKEEKRRGMLSWLTDPLKTKISSIFQRKV